MLCSFANQRSYVRALGRSLVRVRPACLDGVLHRLLPALAYGDLFIHHVPLYLLHLLLTRLPNQDWIQPPPFGIVQVLSLPDRTQLLRNLSTFTPPTAPLQYLERGQVEGPDLCSTCNVHSGGCVACAANMLPKTLADLRVMILTTIGVFHFSGNMWAVRQEAHTFSVTPVSCVTKSVEDIMPALQACHARKRELQCVATEIVQEPGSSLGCLSQTRDALFSLCDRDVSKPSGWPLC